VKVNLIGAELAKVESSSNNIIAACTRYKKLSKQNKIKHLKTRVFRLLSNYIIFISKTNFKPVVRNSGVIQKVEIRADKRDLFLPNYCANASVYI
jgi:folate-dependent tRNA-U54 methylase TrmFO/GidA